MCRGSLGGNKCECFCLCFFFHKFFMFVVHSFCFCFLFPLLVCCGSSTGGKLVYNWLDGHSMAGNGYHSGKAVEYYLTVGIM